MHIKNAYKNAITKLKNKKTPDFDGITNILISTLFLTL